MIESSRRIGHWTAKRLGSVYADQSSNAIGLVRDGKIIAGVIYENWNGVSIMAHMVVEGRLSRAFIGAIFHYAYRVCGVNKVICPVAAANKRSARLVEHMGFIPEALLAGCHPEGDLVLYTLARSDCRFLEGRFSLGQVRTEAPASA